MSSVIKLDLRNSTRFPLRCPVAVTIANDEYHAETVDISAGGVLLHSENSMDVGSTVEFSIELPSDGLGLDYPVSVKCQGRVVRRSAAAPAGGHHVAVVIDDYNFECLQDGSI